MEKNIIKNERNFFYFCLTFFLIIFSDSIIFCYNSNNTFVLLGQYSVVVVSIIFFSIYFFRHNMNFNKDDFFLLISVLFILLAAVYHSEFSGGYISKISLFILGFSICKVCDLKKILEMFQKIMVLICICSLLCMVIMYFFGPLQFLPKIINTSGHTFYWFGLSFMTNDSFIRNYGVFTEPSRFQAYINLAIIIEFFYFDGKINLKRVVLFIITLLTTYSTTGFISFIVIFISFIVSKKNGLSISNKMIIVVSFIGLALLLNRYTDVFLSSVLKIKSGENSESFSVRYNSIFGGIKMIINNFWFGTGIKDANRLFVESTKGLYSVMEKTTYTNTILMSISKFGVIPGIYYIYNLYKSLKCFSKNSFVALLLFLALFFMLSGISFLESIMFNVLPFMHLGLIKSLQTSSKRNLKQNISVGLGVIR